MVILILALGIGVNTTVFRVIDALPVRQFLVAIGVAIDIIADIMLARVLNSPVFGMEPSGPGIHACYASSLLRYDRRMLHPGLSRNQN